jgi:hypothetical protein
MRIMEFVPLSRSPSRAPPTPVALLIGSDRLSGFRGDEAAIDRDHEQQPTAD